VSRTDAPRGWTLQDIHIPGPELAAAVGLHYVTGDEPGIRRRRQGRGFSYRGPDGRPVPETERLRVQGLAVPPAWTDVWISADPMAHVQAIGVDDAGRRQYRYHDRWHEARSRLKYLRLGPFAAALPRLRRRFACDLEAPEGSPRRVLAGVARLLDVGLLRVGNAGSAEDGVFGATTLQPDHVECAGAEVVLRYIGKGGREQDSVLADPELGVLIRECLDLPGESLFTYLDSRGAPRAVRAAEVNAYLAAAGGQPFTAKDFRTWGGTVVVAEHLATGEPVVEDVLHGWSERPDG
jgi:DNA topoisomerase-1